MGATEFAAHSTRSRFAEVLASLLGSRDSYQPSLQIFPLVDTEKLARDLDLTELARQNGAANIPPSEASTPDSVELSIASEMERHAREQADSYRTQRELYDGRAMRAVITEHQRIEIEAAGTSTLSDFRVLVLDDANHLHQLMEEVRQSDEELRAFRREHGLSRMARVVSATTVWQKSMLLLLILIVETAINGTFFAQGSSSGFIGGVTEAIVLSVLNLGVAAAAARFALPCAVHRSVVLKAVGIVSLCAFVAWFTFFNFGVGHFRDQFATGVESVSLDGIYGQLRTHPFALKDTESLVLALLGMMMAMLAFVDVASMRDIYPGYSATAQRRQQAQITYAQTKSQCLAVLQSRRDSAIADMQTAIRALAASAHELQLVLEGRARMHASYCGFLDGLSRAHEMLVRRYREENRRVRTQQAPRFFEAPMQQLPVTFAPELPALALAHNDYRDVAIDRIQYFIKELNDEFERSVSRYPTLTDLTTADENSSAVA